MLSLPDSVYVMGQRWSIVKMEGQIVASTEDMGICDHDNRAIYYRDGQPESGLRDTVMHELLHACWQMLDLTDEDSEESVVRPLSSLLSGMMEDPKNALFWAWMKTSEKTC